MKLTVKGRYLFEDGKPFFWLGDTAWLLFEKLGKADIEFYLDDRAANGFNVIQATMLHTVSGAESGRTARREYFDKIAAAAEYAGRKGIYLALLPCWGDLIKKKIIDTENYRDYAEFLGRRFKDLDNIIWILGGDIRGSAAAEIFCGFAEILKSFNPDRLISFHPFGRTGSYLWFNGCKWLDFNMFQSGHRRYGQKMPNANDNSKEGETDYEEDNYKYVFEGHSLTPLKPCLDAEPSYEGIVQGLHDFSQPRWRARDVRRYAYWSVLSGACGFTYGNNAVMQLHTFGDADANYGVDEQWKTALSADGARQMKYLKELMLSVGFTDGQNRDDLIYGNGEKYGHTSLFVSENFALAYNPQGDEINLKSPFAGGCAAYSFDTKNGRKSFIANLDGNSRLSFRATDGDNLIVLEKL